MRASLLTREAPLHYPLKRLRTKQYFTVFITSPVPGAVRGASPPPSFFYAFKAQPFFLPHPNLPPGRGCTEQLLPVAPEVAARVVVAAGAKLS